MEFEFNFLAVLSASVVAMLLGGLWYSPLLFENKWQRLIDRPADQEAGNPGVIYGGAFLLIFLGASVFHAFLGPDPDFPFAIGVGFAAGLAWAAGSLWISYLFEGRPKGLYFINGGYHIVQYTAFGVIFGWM